MNKLRVKQVNDVSVLQEVCLGYVAPGHLRVMDTLRQRQATQAEVMMFNAGYGALIKYDQSPRSARCFRC
jgi:hypothetical protein